MTDGWIWSSLGIDATDNVTSIRRAYARKLKELDVDADPHVYAQLRQARDIAIDRASAAFAEEEDASFAIDDIIPITIFPEATEPAQDAEADDPISEHHRLFVAILFPDGERSDAQIETDEAEALHGHFVALIADPRLDDVSWFAGVSEWFAEALAQSFPRSQSLLVPAARFFDWPAQDELRRSAAVNWLLSRIEGNIFVAEVETRGHSLHKAWVELTRPTDAKSRRGKVPIEQVGELLSLVRTRYPHLEDRFDWYRVQLWEQPVGSSSKTWRGVVVWIVVILLLQAIRFCEQKRSVHTPSPSSNTAPFDIGPSGDQSLRRQDDIDHVLRAGFDGAFGLAELRAKDAKLVELLEKSWIAVNRDGGTFDMFRTAASGVLAARFNQDLIRADYPTIVELLQLMLREARAVRSKDPGACADHLRQRRISYEFSPELQRQRRALIGRILLEARAAQQDVADPNYPSYEISGEVMTDAARRAAMPGPMFVEALERFDAKPRARCGAQIALLEAILALPQDKGFALMRKMMGTDPEPAP